MIFDISKDLITVNSNDNQHYCPYPSVPLYADVQLSSEFIVNGTKAFYKCNDGYELFGTTIIRTCIDRKWSGTLPYCGKEYYFLSLNQSFFTNQKKSFGY